MTVGERLLWSVLRARGLGWKFRRQHPIASRIADFACPELRVVLEVDGSTHWGRGFEDEERERELNALGWDVIRVSEAEVRADPIDVALRLEEALAHRVRNVHG